MPNSTIYARLQVCKTIYENRNGLVSLGQSEDRIGFLPPNSYAGFHVANISLVSKDTDERPAITYCYGYDYRLGLAPIPPETRISEIEARIYVRINTHFSTSSLFVRQTVASEKKAEVFTYIPDNIIGIFSSREEYSSYIIGTLMVACNTNFSNIPVDIVYRASNNRMGILAAEAFSVIMADICTNHKEDYRLAQITDTRSADAYSEITAKLPRLIGEPLEYVLLEVLLGSRSISNRTCEVSVPSVIYDEIKAGTSYITAGKPKWSRFSAGSSVFIRLMNLGGHTVEDAVLRTLNENIDAVSVEMINSLCQIRFDSKITIGDNYIIVLTIQPNNNVIVLDSPKGEFTLI